VRRGLVMVSVANFNFIKQNPKALCESDVPPFWGDRKSVNKMKKQKLILKLIHLRYNQIK
jgi:hypothetical protein